MKLKKYLLNKQTIYLISCIILSLSLISVYIFYDKGVSIPTVAKLDNKLLVDINGDGVKEEISKTIKNKNVSISIKTSSKTYILDDLSTVDSLQDINLYFSDLTRDSIDDLIIHINKDSSSKVIVYSFTNDDFKKLFTGDATTLGLINTTNNRTPILVIGDKEVSKFPLYTYMFIDNKKKDLNYNSSHHFGEDTISALISFITNYSNDNSPLPQELISKYFNGDTYHAFESIPKQMRPTYKNSYFTDLKYNKDGILSSLQWNLSFKCEDANLNSTKLNFIVYLELEGSPDSYCSYKIQNIILAK